MNTLAMSPFLRRVLTADAVLSGASAVLMLAGSGPLSSLTGLPTTLLAVAGAALLPYVAWLLWLARRPAVPRGAVWSVVALNLVWAVDCAAVAFTGWLAPTGLGLAFLLVQAVTVVVFAELGVMALRRAAPRHAMA